MGLISEITSEGDAQFICNLVKEMLEKSHYSPETVEALKEVARETLDTLLYAVPDWAVEYYKLFAPAKDDKKGGT